MALLLVRRQKAAGGRFFAGALCGLLAAQMLAGNLVASSYDKAELRRIIDELQPKIDRDRTEMDLMFWPDLLKKFPDLQYLTSRATDFQEAAIELYLEEIKKNKGIEYISLGKTSTLLVAAMYGLPSRKYLCFVEKILARTATEQSPLDEFDISALIFPNDHLLYLFQYNYNDAQVRRVLGKARDRAVPFPSDPIDAGAVSMAANIEYTLSGEAAKGLNEARWEYPRNYPNNLDPPRLEPY